MEGSVRCPCTMTTVKSRGQVKTAIATRPATDPLARKRASLLAELMPVVRLTISMVTKSTYSRRRNLETSTSDRALLP